MKPVAERRVDRTEIAADIVVSTVYLGPDHDHNVAGEGGCPRVYESMVLGGPLDGRVLRCSTGGEALELHAFLVAEVRRALAEGTRGQGARDR